jgi:hypothetical protein
MANVGGRSRMDELDETTAVSLSPEAPTAGVEVIKTTDKSMN